MSGYTLCVLTAITSILQEDLELSLYISKNKFTLKAGRSLIRGAKLTTWKKHAEIMTRRDQRAVNNNLCLALHSSFFYAAFLIKQKLRVIDSIRRILSSI